MKKSELKEIIREELTEAVGSSPELIRKWPEILKTAERILNLKHKNKTSLSKKTGLITTEAMLYQLVRIDERGQAHSCGVFYQRRNAEVVKKIMEKVQMKNVKDLQVVQFSGTFDQHDAEKLGIL